MKHNLVYSREKAAQRLSANCKWQEAEKYLSQSEQLHGIDLQHLWQILDQAWDESLEKSQNKLDLSKFLHEYYSHPVWLINNAFCESDIGTISDRMAAVRLITHVHPRKILDFGGGIGTVSRLCSISFPQAEKIDLVDITEFRHTITQHLSSFPNIRVLANPDPLYDAVISTEVLEHLIDPVGAVVEINRLLRIGGSFAASWSFVPVIKCHLPQNFHLRQSMFWIIRSLGLRFYGFERRGTTVYSFIKHAEVTPEMIKLARLLELFSRLRIPLDRLLLLIRGL